MAALSAEVARLPPATHVLRKDGDIGLLEKALETLPNSTVPTRGDVIRYFFYLKEGPMKYEKHVSNNGTIA